MTLTATTSGGLYAVLGWRTMNLVALIPIATILALIGVAAYRRPARA